MTTNPVITITDEQITEIEAATILQAFRCCENPSIGGEYMGQCELVCCGNPESTEAGISIAADDVLALISRLRAAEKDAERYRWLRDKSSMPGVLCSNSHAEYYFTEYMICEEEMDQAIDAAMEQSE